MNKADIVSEVHKKLGGTRVQAEDIVEDVFGSIIMTVAKGEDCSIAGFGIFEPRERAARMGRNPKTGMAIQISAKRAPKFRAAKAFKDAVAK